jgi:hypothetical protein
VSPVARKLGTTREELAEIALIAAVVRAEATVAHGPLALRLFDEASPDGDPLMASHEQAFRMLWIRMAASERIKLRLWCPLRSFALRRSTLGTKS